MDDIIKKIETTNTGINIMISSLDEQLSEMNSNPIAKEFADDLEKLFNAYLKTWLISNNEIIDLLKKRNKHSQ